MPEGRERGSPETGGAPVHTGKLPHRRSCEVLENWTKQGRGGQETEKATLLSPLTAPQTDRGLRLRKPRMAAAHKPTQHTQTLQHRGQAQVVECDAENMAGAKGGTRC